MSEFLSIIPEHLDDWKIVLTSTRRVVHITPSAPRIWRTTTQASPILEVSILAPIIEFFLQLVAVERFFVELIIILSKVRTWAMWQSSHNRTVKIVVCRLWIKPQTCDFHDLFLFCCSWIISQLTAVYCNRRGVYKTTPQKTVCAVWISTRNSRTGQKLNKLAQLQQLNCWHEVQSENSRQCVKWPEKLWKSVERCWCKCMSHRAL